MANDSTGFSDFWSGVNSLTPPRTDWYLKFRDLEKKHARVCGNLKSVEKQRENDAKLIRSLMQQRDNLEVENSDMKSALQELREERESTKSALIERDKVLEKLTTRLEVRNETLRGLKRDMKQAQSTGTCKNMVNSSVQCEIIAPGISRSDAPDSGDTPEKTEMHGNVECTEIGGNSARKRKNGTGETAGGCVRMGSDGKRRYKGQTVTETHAIRLAFFGSDEKERPTTTGKCVREDENEVDGSKRADKEPGACALSDSEDDIGDEEDKGNRVEALNARLQCKENREPGTKAALDGPSAVVSDPKLVNPRTVLLQKMECRIRRYKEKLRGEKMQQHSLMEEKMALEQDKQDLVEQVRNLTKQLEEKKAELSGVPKKHTQPLDCKIQKQKERSNSVGGEVDDSRNQHHNERTRGGNGGPMQVQSNVLGPTHVLQPELGENGDVQDELKQKDSIKFLDKSSFGGNEQFLVGSADCPNNSAAECTEPTTKGFDAVCECIADRVMDKLDAAFDRSRQASCLPSQMNTHPSLRAHPSSNGNGVNCDFGGELHCWANVEGNRERLSSQTVCRIEEPDCGDAVTDNGNLGQFWRELSGTMGRVVNKRLEDGDVGVGDVMKGLEAERKLDGSRGGAEHGDGQVGDDAYRVFGKRKEDWMEGGKRPGCTEMVAVSKKLRPNFAETVQMENEFGIQCPVYVNNLDRTDQMAKEWEEFQTFLKFQEMKRKFQ